MTLPVDTHGKIHTLLLEVRGRCDRGADPVLDASLDTAMNLNERMMRRLRNMANNESDRRKLWNTDV